MNLQFQKWNVRTPRNVAAKQKAEMEKWRDRGERAVAAFSLQLNKQHQRHATESAPHKKRQRVFGSTRRSRANKKTVSFVGVVKNQDSQRMR